ncbi:MAG: sn-glycerol-1-phosphate dehydrogenase [Lentisphaerae bacterium]|nr:sn-glycerol-1-phosphate dehydrogenase [Lentisphaerota bacterium]
MPEIPIPAGLSTKRCLLGTNILAEVGHALQEHWPGQEVILIADENTWAAAGKEVEQLLLADRSRMAAPVIFPAQPMLHADYKYVEQLRTQLQGRVPVAIGSGTINDLVKRASFEAETGGYLCVATAASVDGYTSAGAALTVDGFKQTMPCGAPLVILADNAVLAKAPPEMAAAGYADLAAKVVAGADWLVADQLGCDPLDAVAWDMVQKHLREWLSDPEGVLSGKSTAMEDLFTGLAYTGFSMQYYTKSSRPASGAEHMMSHIWEMRGLKCKGQEVSHGFKVALGTLIVAALYEEMGKISAAELSELLAQQPLMSSAERQAEVERELGGTPFYQNASAISQEKLLTGDALLQRRQLILQAWPEMQQKIARQLIPFTELQRRFRIVRCPVEPAEIGLSRAAMLNGILADGMIRNRYSILDLLAETGLRDRVLQSVLTGGYFSQYLDERTR